jgi:hypothetical protein
MTDRPMTFAYIVERVHPDIPTDRAQLSGGLRPLPTAWGLRALAEELIRETRVRHSYVGTGRLRCSLWLHHDDEPRPLTAGCETAPPDADAFEYGDLTP